MTPVGLGLCRRVFCKQGCLPFPIYDEIIESRVFKKIWNKNWATVTKIHEMQESYHLDTQMIKIIFNIKVHRIFQIQMTSQVFIYRNLGIWIMFRLFLHNEWSSQHSWIQRAAAAVIMVNPMITDTEPNLINCSAIFFDNLVDSRTMLCRHGLDYQIPLRQDSKGLF